MRLWIVLVGSMAISAPSLFALQVEPAADRRIAPAGGWNDARALELVQRAREARLRPIGDGVLSEYQARALGQIYFYMDRPTSTDHVLVKADQVALELYWRAPANTKQRIVGQRDERVLPTSIQYHIDHLTVVMDDYGDRIRLGDGDEVAAVVHPVSDASDGVYDYRLADSLSLSYGDGSGIRVYELQVRPRSFAEPGIVGSVFLDRESSSVVRMNFSFTPASYVDPFLDYIRISLDNSLWLGSVWLPYRQEIELRRETPFFDASVGSVIRTRFQIREYDFDTAIDESVFIGSNVIALPRTQRERYPFEEGPLARVEEEGLTTSATMDDVRAEVREVAGSEVLSGLSSVRLSADGLSDFARYNRAEGVYLGGGISHRPRGDLTVRPTLGFSFGRKRVAGGLDLERDRSWVELYWDRLRDVGGHAGAEPLVNSISAASGEKDYLDPYFARGLSAGVGDRASGTWVGLRVEEHVSASDVVSSGGQSDFRPVRSVRDGFAAVAEASSTFGLPGGGRSTAVVRVGAVDGAALTAATGTARWELGSPWTSAVHGSLSLAGGATMNRAAPQALFQIGGRHTLPGHDYRAFVGHRYWLGRAEATIPLRRPYVGLRLFTALGATYLSQDPLPGDWIVTDSRGLEASVGVGLSIAWDSVYLDVGRGVRGGSWEAVMSVSERFRDWM